MAKKWNVEILDNKSKENVVPLIEELMQDIRPHDKEDLEASSDPVFVLIGSIKLDEETRVYRGEDGKLLAIFGKGTMESRGSTASCRCS